jgi:ComF family protein
MQLKKFLLRLRRIVGQGLFPYRCCHCDRLYTPAADDERDEPKRLRQLDGFLCRACHRLLDPITSPLCVICGRPFETEHGVNHVCSRCESTAYGFEAARSAVTYTSAIRRMVHLYKYEGRAQLARPFGSMLWKALLSHWQADQFDLVIPVPLHRKRLRRRGYNQSALLLRHWPAPVNACPDTAGQFRIVPELMVRHRATRPQIGLDADARRANMRDAFSVRDPSIVKAKHVLVVDDVLTTGATANACARVLKRAGAASVRVLTLARAVG